LDLLLQSDSEGDDTETTFGLGPVVVDMFDVNSLRIPILFPYGAAGRVFLFHFPPDSPKIRTGRTSE